MTQPLPQPIPQGAGFFRRFGAWFYDLLILIALEIVAVGLFLIVVFIGAKVGVLSLDGYLDMADFINKNPTANSVFTCYVFAIGALFYAYFWSQMGQTIGMKAWKLKVIDESGGRISFTQGLIRLATACFGLGNLFVFFSKDKRAFQDLFSQSQVILIK